MKDSDWREEARDMVRRTIEARGVRNPAVLRAMEETPRHRYVPPGERVDAYADMPLPIGHGQTISQPYIVAFMTEAARPRPGDRVLEVGTGSGYQAAVLSRLVKEVFTIELIPELGTAAEARLKAEGVVNATCRIGDGYAGWPEAAPFDSILVTAAPEEVPRALIDQLKVGGRMVIPVGPTGGIQDLLVIEKVSATDTVRHNVMAVRFVPLVKPR